ncbi:hypothetical protein D3C87_1612440 [compost metagenome]
MVKVGKFDIRKLLEQVAVSRRAATDDHAYLRILACQIPDFLVRLDQSIVVIDLVERIEQKDERPGL